MDNVDSKAWLFFSFSGEVHFNRFPHFQALAKIGGTVAAQLDYTLLKNTEEGRSIEKHIKDITERVPTGPAGVAKVLQHLNTVDGRWGHLLGKFSHAHFLFSGHARKIDREWQL